MRWWQPPVLWLDDLWVAIFVAALLIWALASAVMAVGGWLRRRFEKKEE